MAAGVIFRLILRLCSETWASAASSSMMASLALWIFRRFSGTGVGLRTMRPSGEITMSGSSRSFPARGARIS